MLAGVLTFPKVLVERCQPRLDRQRAERERRNRLEGDRVLDRLGDVFAPREGPVAVHEHGGHIVSCGRGDRLAGARLVLVVGLRLAERRRDRHRAAEVVGVRRAQARQLASRLRPGGG